MGLLDKIVKSMANGGIERVLVIDDAFDPPVLDGALAAELSGFLDGAAAMEIAAAAGVYATDRVTIEMLRSTM